MSKSTNTSATGSEIIPGTGLPKLIFGTSREEILELLGQPDDVDRYSDEEDFSSETWHYDDLELSLVVEEVEDWRLTTFTVSSDVFTFEGMKLIGLSKEVLEEKLNALDQGEVVYEDWSDDDQEDFALLSIPDLNLNFWLLEGELTEIQWGVPYDEQDEVIWPEQ